MAHKFNTNQWAKFAQSFYGSGVQLVPTLSDLYNAIRADGGLDIVERAQLINQIKGMTGYEDGSTPLSDLMSKGLGSAIGWLISKYFGMGVVGQLVSTLAGYGIGSKLNSYLNTPPDPFTGTQFGRIM